MPEHTDLIGLEDAELLELAPEATHQHKKGGLYRLLGPPRDSNTALIARRANGDAILVYEHLYPHRRELWIRSSAEFYERGRFRELHRARS